MESTTPFRFGPLTPEFQLALEQRPGSWAVRCTGILDAANAARSVQPELLRLHEAVLAAGVGGVELEMQDVEYMSSSGLKSFMAWFLTAANAAGGGYTIRVRFNPARSWQHLSFRPMERLAPNTVKLEPSGAVRAAGTDG